MNESEQDIDRDISPEKELRPDFLEKLSEDYPEISETVSERLPSWIEGVDKYTGVTGTGEAILDEIRYVSKEEEIAFCKNIAADIVQDLDTDPTSKVLLAKYRGGNRSESYFQEMIVSEIPEQYRERISSPEGNNEHFASIRDENVKFVYHVDDSANSGQQIQGALFENLAPVTEEERSGLEVRSYLFGITDQAKDNLEPFMVNNLQAELVEDDGQKIVWKSERYNTTVTINAPHTPDMSDVANQMVSDGKITEDKKGDVTFHAHHNRNVGTLLLFHHRLLQDNVASVLVEGRQGDHLLANGVTPLFEGFSKVNAYKK